MAAFDELVAGLRRAEQQLEQQLHGIRTAISSLASGGSPSSASNRRRSGRPKGEVRKRRRMSAAARAKISAAQKARARWSLHAVSAFLGHANVTTTARYLNVKDDYLQELIERKPLTLVKN
jgi:integrase